MMGRGLLKSANFPNFLVYKMRDITMGVVDTIWVLIVSSIPGLNNPK